MEVLLLAVGRLRPYYREACDDYLRRLGRHARVREAEVKEASRAPSAEAQRTTEADRLLSKIPERAILVPLSRGGRPWSSEALAERVAAWRLAARPLALVLGGSVGLAPSLLERAEAVWSLGPATYPHELARVMVTEQLYRAFSLLAGLPYHKGAS